MEFVESHTPLPVRFCAETVAKLISTRSFSSSSKSSVNSQDSAEDVKWSLLYHRSNRATYPRATLTFSTFNLFYWLWYTFDFTPAVNASAHEKAALGQIDAETLELLLVDNSMGYVGLGVALVIWGGSVWYPKRLITAIWKSEDDDENNHRIAISTLKMPFVTESNVLKKMKSFNGVENTIFTETELRSDSNIQFFNAGEIGIVGEKETNDILVNLDGELGRKRGHLALQAIDAKNETSSATSSAGPLSLLTKKNYLLDIGSEDEIMVGANSHLLRAFLFNDFQLQSAANPKVGRRRNTKGLEQNDQTGTTIIRPKGHGKKKR
ncbi:hypothetical protein HJC23_003238 [Cyclotella cryptica]|uniref:Uncharacterized protein n=1 Tax=Cyclotella cryptica TaxID=29204 RepID=A0ABD3QXH3_9STRA|eukprot:CCRYP_000768-RA/>CCRYP_000768-RA protein AED:0.00 eAED:0.00 QI:370/-1/1/1/-1/1/1/210/322